MFAFLLQKNGDLNNFGAQMVGTEVFPLFPVVLQFMTVRCVLGVGFFIQLYFWSQCSLFIHCINDIMRCTAYHQSICESVMIPDILRLKNKCLIKMYMSVSRVSKLHLTPKRCASCNFISEIIPIGHNGRKVLLQSFSVLSVQSQETDSCLKHVRCSIILILMLLFASHK